MKLRQYNRRALTSNIELKIYDVPETNEINIDSFEILFNQLNSNDIQSVNNLIKLFDNGNDLGSLVTGLDIDYSGLLDTLNSLEKHQLSFELSPLIDYVKSLLKVSKLLVMKYHTVITNPPYMGSSRMNKVLSDFAKKNYPDSKADLFSMFIERWNKSTFDGGYNCMVTMQSWMFLSSFEKMRTNLLNKYTISNLMHMENNVMGIAFGTAVTIIRNVHLPEFVGTYHQIKTQDAAGKIPTSVPISGNRYNRTNQANFDKIPGSPVAYWASNRVFDIFNKNKLLSDFAYPRLGMATANNDLFLRRWYETSLNNINFNSLSTDDSQNSGDMWFPYNKGGNYRKWYGNNEYIVNWKNNGLDIRNYKDTQGKVKSHNYNLDFIFKPGITWNALTSGNFSSRKTESGFLFDNAGSTMFLKNNDNLNYLQGLLSTPIVSSMLNYINPTLNFQPGSLARLPIVLTDKSAVDSISKTNVKISKDDWDSFETSWDFKSHPLLNHIADDKRTEVNGELENAFGIWKNETQDRFNQLKSNEEELNKIFIDLYGLQDELTPEVADKDVSVRLADEERDIKSFLSYFVGVVFGRYSLDIEGLAFAGGDWDESKYNSFVPNDDNLIMLNDKRYFDDKRDIINRLKEFLIVTFGEDSLKENLHYIASVIGKKADNDEDSIRRYFVENFFKDHKQMYQKRPIYWEFSSGKANGFKALMYLHRYDENELAMIRTNYLHPLQGKYEAQLDQMSQLVETESVTKEKKKLEKDITHVTKQLAEIRKYDVVIQHIANEKILLDLDDGVVENYKKLQSGENILSKNN